LHATTEVSHAILWQVRMMLCISLSNHHYFTSSLPHSFSDIQASGEFDGTECSL